MFPILLQCHWTWWYVRRRLSQYQYLNLLRPSSRMKTFDSEIHGCLWWQIHGSSFDSAHFQVLSLIKWAGLWPYSRYRWAQPQWIDKSWETLADGCQIERYSVQCMRRKNIRVFSSLWRLRWLPRPWGFCVQSSWSKEWSDPQHFLNFWEEGLCFTICPDFKQSCINNSPEQAPFSCRAAMQQTICIRTKDGSHSYMRHKCLPRWPCKI